MNCQARSFICFLLSCLFSVPLQTFADTFDPPPYYAKDSFDNNHPSIDTLPVAEKNYRELQGILPIYQNAVLHPWPFVPNTQKLKYGVHNSSVPLLRARLAGSHDLVMTSNLNDHFFDDELEAAVEKFQRLHGLKVDGVVGKATLDELNVPAAARLHQIEVNMQRWRELSPQLSDRFIMVNVPDFELYVFENNIKVLSMKAIVGKPDRQTPELVSRVTRLVFNPPCMNIF